MALQLIAISSDRATKRSGGSNGRGTRGTRGQTPRPPRPPERLPASGETSAYGRRRSRPHRDFLPNQRKIHARPKRRQGMCRTCPRSTTVSANTGMRMMKDLLGRKVDVKRVTPSSVRLDVIVPAPRRSSACWRFLLEIAGLCSELQTNLTLQLSTSNLGIDLAERE